MAYQLVTNQQLTTSTPHQLGKNLHDYIMITQVVPLRCRISGAKKATEPQKDLVPRWPTPSWRSADAWDVDNMLDMDVPKKDGILDIWYRL